MKTKALRIELGYQPDHPSAFHYRKCVEIVMPEQVIELAEGCVTTHSFHRSCHVLALTVNSRKSYISRADPLASLLIALAALVVSRARP